jgi:hypothetical protein
MVAACALLALPAAAAADEPLGGIAVGAPVSAAAATLGPPADVNSGDDGQRFAFPSGSTAYTDDDGIVLAVDMRSGSPAVEIDGHARRFAIGAYTAARADADLAADAEYSSATVRSYRLAPRRDLVLAFDASTARLQRLAYGEPGQLARLGLLPGDPAAKAVVYRAPRPRSGGAPGAGFAGDGMAAGRRAVFRVGVDRFGNVTSVDVLIASGDGAADTVVAGRIRGARYAPAQLDGRPIAATVFVEARP